MERNIASVDLWEVILEFLLGVEALNLCRENVELLCYYSNFVGCDILVSTESHEILLDVRKKDRDKYLFSVYDEDRGLEEEYEVSLVDSESLQVIFTDLQENGFFA